MNENEFRINHLVFGFFAGAIVSGVLLFFPYVGNESAFMLLIFN